MDRSENTIIISVEIENQINLLEEDDKRNFMKLIGIKETGLNSLITKGYRLLKLETFYIGPEVKSMDN